MDFIASDFCGLNYRNPNTAQLAKYLFLKKCLILDLTVACAAYQVTQKQFIIMLIQAVFYTF